MELTILIPCLNEEETLGICIEKAKNYIKDMDAEVLVADNGSTDNSVKIAESYGARVVTIKEKGYGQALIGGTKAAKGKYIIMGDADDSYDFSNLDLFVEKLRNGYDLVMGNRFKGGIEKDAMPFLHRYLGTPVLSFVGRMLYHNKIGDYNCGLRGYSRQRFLDLNLQASGMEYASEMIIQASLHHYSITEVPTTLSKDKRSHPPHLHTWRDGFRHLKMLIGTKLKGSCHLFCKKR